MNNETLLAIRSDLEFCWWMIVLAVIFGNFLYDTILIVFNKVIVKIKQAAEPYTSKGIGDRKQ